MRQGKREILLSQEGGKNYSRGKEIVVCTALDQKEANRHHFRKSCLVEGRGSGDPMKKGLRVFAGGVEKKVRIKEGAYFTSRGTPTSSREATLLSHKGGGERLKRKAERNLTRKGYHLQSKKKRDSHVRKEN